MARTSGGQRVSARARANSAQCSRGSRLRVRSTVCWLGVQGRGCAGSAHDPGKAGAHRRAPPGGLVQARAAATLALIMDQMRLIYDAA